MSRASAGSLSCSSERTLRSRRSKPSRSVASLTWLRRPWNSRNPSSRSSTWFLSESFVNTPIALVSRSRFSSDDRSRAGGSSGVDAGDDVEAAGAAFSWGRGVSVRGAGAPVRGAGASVRRGGAGVSLLGLRPSSVSLTEGVDRLAGPGFTTSSVGGHWRWAQSLAWINKTRQLIANVVAAPRTVTTLSALPSGPLDWGLSHRLDRSSSIVIHPGPRPSGHRISTHARPGSGAMPRSRSSACNGESRRGGAPDRSGIARPVSRLARDQRQAGVVVTSLACPLSIIIGSRGCPVAAASLRRTTMVRGSHDHRRRIALGAGPQPPGAAGDRVRGDRVARQERLGREALMPQPVLVVINVQERLFDAMDADRRDDMIRNTKILGIAARRLGMPVQQAGS
jgi:hypothetical protein